MPLPAVQPLTKTMERTFIRWVDTGRVENVKAMLQLPAVRAAIPGKLGDHAVRNVDRWLPILQKDYADAVACKIPGTIAIDGDLLKANKSIVAELRDAGAKLTQRLVDFLR